MIRLLMVLTIGIATLAFGGTPDWARYSIVLAIGLLAIGTAIMQFRDPADRFTKFDLVAAFGFGIVCLWALAQALPSSANWFDIATITRDAANSLDVKPLTSISATPSHTLDGLVWLVTLGVWFALALTNSQRHDRFGHVGLWAVVGLAVTFAFYGLVLRAIGLEIVLWHEKEAYVGTLTGPFINRNHFATFLAIGLVCTTALMFEVRDRPGAQKRMAQAGVGSSLAGFRWDRAIALLLCWGVLGTALVLTQSRGGMASALFGLAFVVGAGLLTGKRGIMAGFVLLVLLSVGGALLILANSETLADRFYFADWALEGRLALYQHVLDIAAPYLWTGTGLGTFEEVFRMFKPDIVTQYFDYAHNTYLELVFEIGLIATLILLSIQAIYLLIAFGAVRTLRRSPATALAATGAGAVVALHAVADFSIQIPAVAITYLFLLGTAIGEARLVRKAK